VTSVLGIDPGNATGWCCYDIIAHRVTASGHFPEDQVPAPTAVPEWGNCLDVVLERPVAHGPTYPQVVDCAWFAGSLARLFRMRCDPGFFHVLIRRDIKRILTDATAGDVRVKNDATAWAALKLLHGGEASAKKGGCLYGVKSHSRAALAVAVAWHLNETAKVKT